MPDHLFLPRPRPVAHVAALTSALALVAVAAGAIVYEACIAHYLRGALGGDAGPWVTTVTIAGSFIGVYAIRPFVARSQRPLAMAGRILAVVAIVCAAFPYAISLLFESYIAAGIALGPDSTGLPLLRLALAVVAAVPPAAGAAATVPYLATAYARSTRAPAAAFAHVATFLASGAVLGIILGVWAWVAEFGLHVAMLLVGLGQLVLSGALVVVASRVAQSPPSPPVMPWRPTPDPALRAELLAATAFGFAGLAALHAGWTRLAMHVVRPSHEVVWLTRMALALGAVFGAGAAARWIGRGSQPARLAGAGLLAAGGFVLFSLPLYKQLAYGVNTLRNALSGTDGGYGLFNAVLLVALISLAGLATMFASVALPAIWCALTRRPWQWGEDIADVLGAQQLGVLAGLLLAGVAMSQFGLQHTFVLGSICLGCAGGAILYRHAERRRVLILGLGATAVFAAYAGVAQVGWDGEVMLSRQMRPSSDEPDFASFVAEQSRMTTLYDEESASERVQVVELNGVRYLLAEGAYLGSSAQYLVRADEMAALLPWILHAGEPKNAFVVRFGAGVSAGALASVGVQVTTAEPYALVPDAARVLGPWNSYAGDLEGLDIHHGDARDLLLFLPQRRYDIIVGSRLPRDVIGAADDSTLQFMALLRSRLAPGGLYAQVLETYGMSEHEFTHTLKTIRASFPWATVWRFSDKTALVLAGETKPTLDFAKMTRRLQGQTIPPHAEHSSVEIQTPLELLAHEQISGTTLAALFTEKPPLWNRLFPKLAENASRSRFRGDEVATPRRYDERRQAGGRPRLMVAELLAHHRPSGREYARVAGLVEYTRSQTVAQLIRTAAHSAEIDEVGIDRAILNNQALPLALARAKRIAVAAPTPDIELCDRYIQRLESELRSSRSVFWTADPTVMVALVARCVDEHPDASLPWRVDLATTLRDLGDLPRAAQTASFALTAPQIADRPRSTLLRIYARSQAQLGDHAEARRGFQELLKVRPRDIEAQRYLKPRP